MVYYIGCQDCDSIGKIDASSWWRYKAKTCPTCKGETLVPVGTKFNRGYPHATWLKPKVTINPNAVLDTRGSNSAMCSVNRNASNSRSDDDRRDDGMGIGTVLLAATVLSNASNETNDDV